MVNRKHHITDKHILRLTRQLRVPHSKSESQAWDEMGLEKTRWFGYTSWKVAASISIILLSALTFWSQYVSVSTSKGEHTTLVLPDNSRVSLNADSKIKYHNWLWNISRSVTLEGEGYFEVERGSKFTVISDRLTVAVKGTKFNIRDRRESEPEVLCTEGKVSVSDNINSTVYLNANEIVKGHTTSYNVNKAPANNSLSWIKGEFFFDNAKLKEVIASLERQFDIRIDIPKENLNRMYSGYFNNRKLDEALELVFLPLGMDYSLENNKVIIKQNRKTS